MKRFISSLMCLILLVLPALMGMTAPAAAIIQAVSQPLTLSGNGNAKENIQLDFQPSRVILSGSAVMDISQGESSESFSSETSSAAVMYLQGALTVNVKAAGDWSLTVEPIGSGGTLPVAGKGPFISNIISLTASIEGTFTADGTKLTGTASPIKAVMKYPPLEGGGLREEIILDDSLAGPDKLRVTAAYTLNPEGQGLEGVLFIDCLPEVEWSILVDGLPAPVLYSELTIGSQGPDVLALKKRFFELGYFRTAAVNDKFTDITAETVELFERNNGLPIDGIADPVMLSVLYSDSAVGK